MTSGCEQVQDQAGQEEPFLIRTSCILVTVCKYRHEKRYENSTDSSRKIKQGKENKVYIHLKRAFLLPSLRMTEVEMSTVSTYTSAYVSIYTSAMPINCYGRG